ncbi:MAG: SEC-C domain-containing protein [Deltaproteobacteria bacterium]|nr:SEC-C domain-containing protein [Deltaproteobacteria bacterium]MBW2307915.1 SEC-C domain-containing protein [Deltaproteobacteria bacterium]
MVKIKRNAPCPCGSGKKYKKCCLQRNDAAQISPKTYHDYCLEVVNALRPKILKFIKQNNFDRHIVRAKNLYWQPLEKYLDSPEMDKADFLAFMEWFVHDFIIPEKGKPAIQLYFESTPKLTTKEMQVLKDWQDAYLSVFQVKEVKPGEGFLAEDIFTQEEVFISDVTLSRNVRKWELVTIRKIKVLNEWQASAAGSKQSPRDKGNIRQFVLECFADYKKEHPESSLNQFLRERGYLLNHYRLTQHAKPDMPKIITSSGEQVVFREALYHVKDFLAVAKALEKAEDFEASNWVEDDSGHLLEINFDWLQRGKSGKFDIENKIEDGLELKTYATYGPSEKQYLVLGTVKLVSGRLTLAVMGNERFALGKKRLEEILKGLVKHRLDSLTSIESAFRRGKTQSPPSRKKEIPAEIQKTILKNALDNHFKNWVNMPLKGLGGLSPKEAVNSKEGRIQVEDLLRELEYLYSGKESNISYDISWIRKELGLV